MEVSIVAEVRDATRNWRKAKRRAQDMRPAWRKISDLVERSIRRNFLEGGRPDRWTPRKDSLPHPILIKSGRLVGSLRKRSGQTFSEVSTAVKYAAVHHFGGSRIPARPYMMLQREDEREIVEIIKQHILRPLV